VTLTLVCNDSTKTAGFGDDLIVAYFDIDKLVVAARVRVAVEEIPVATFFKVTFAFSTTAHWIAYGPKHSCAFKLRGDAHSK